jgi:hypothetical protein
MRTAIYVHEPSTVTIRATDPRDARVELSRYHQGTQAAVGAHQLDRGIYLIVSSCAMEVTGAGLTPGVAIDIIRNDKDIPPDPKATVVALEPGATAASVIQFLTVAKDISPDD